MSREQSGESRTRLDHVAIAVRSLDESLPFYRDQFGLALLGIEIVESEGVRVAKLDVGNTHIELLEPTGPDSPVARFINDRGPGLHHICIGVRDIDGELDCLKAGGARLVNEKARTGAGGARIAFVHPRATGGVLIELSQPGEAGKD